MFIFFNKSSYIACTVVKVNSLRRITERCGLSSDYFARWHLRQRYVESRACIAPLPFHKSIAITGPDLAGESSNRASVKPVPAACVYTYADHCALSTTSPVAADADDPVALVTATHTEDAAAVLLAVQTVAETVRLSLEKTAEILVVGMAEEGRESSRRSRRTREGLEHRCTQVDCRR